MTLPYFLLLIATVIMAAAMTIWVSVTAGVPLVAIGLLALTGAAVLHLTLRNNES